MGLAHIEKCCQGMQRLSHPITSRYIPTKPDDRGLSWGPVGRSQFFCTSDLLLAAAEQSTCVPVMQAQKSNTSALPGQIKK